MTITHAFTNPKSDGGDTTVVRPSDWNAGHVVSGLSLAFTGCKATTASYGVSTATFTAVQLDAEDFDTDGFHSIASNTSQVIIPAGLGGKYLVIAQGNPANSTAGNVRYVLIYKNGTEVARDADEAPSATSGGYSKGRTVTAVLDLVPTDYVTVTVYQDSGSTLAYSAALTVAKLDSGKVQTTPVYCRASQTANQSIANATFTPFIMQTDDSDASNVHFTSDSNLTGTVAKTAASTAIVGTGTAFTTELSVNQVIAIPGTTTEYFGVASIADNTHLTAYQAAVNTASGQTGARTSSCIVAPRAGFGVVSAYGIWASGSSDRWTQIAVFPAVGGIANSVNTKDSGGGGDYRDPIAMPHVFVQGDIIQISGRQDSGGALNVANVQLVLAMS